MARNLEYKARIESEQGVLERARALGAELWGDLKQTDTYYAVPRGRLKLREMPGFRPELIFYERAESESERESDYHVVHVIDSGDMVRDLLGRAFAIVAVVKKQRRLVLLDTTRIHLDNVEGLGHFPEVEVPVGDDEESASRRLAFIIEGLGLRLEDGIRASYADLIRERQS